VQRQVIRCRKGHLTIIENEGHRICTSPRCGARGDLVTNSEGHTVMPFKQAERLVNRLKDEARAARKQSVEQPEAEAVA